LLINTIVMAAPERVLKTCFIILYLLGICYSVENGELLLAIKNVLLYHNKVFLVYL
jgi:hypothetical protein